MSKRNFTIGGLHEVIVNYLISCDLDPNNHSYKLNELFNNKSIEPEALNLILNTMIDKMAEVLQCSRILSRDKKLITLEYVRVALETEKFRSRRMI